MTAPSTDGREFVVLMHADEAVWEHAGPQVREAYVAGHVAFAEQAGVHGVRILTGYALDVAATATTLRRAPGPGASDTVSLTDGPFAETVEQLTGFYVVTAPDLDAVLDLCRLLPPYTIEVRPTTEV